MLLVPCPACSAMLERGALRCRFCNADARAATQPGGDRAPPRPARPRPATGPAHSPRDRGRDPERELEELLALSRELYFGP
ncbi:MAG TPA: hypothetical protein VFP65_12760 [Anaeromyxobacteraceae bacterium]|nr:hypothetical protein [Anaeromyxobacteraceae bacterium]